jgi:hypothetical protein
MNAWTTDLSLAESPKVYLGANQVINGNIGALIHQPRRQAAERIDPNSGNDVPMRRIFRKISDRPLEAHDRAAQQEIGDLEEGNGFEERVECLCGEVPEYFRPEECFD